MHDTRDPTPAKRSFPARDANALPAAQAGQEENPWRLALEGAGGGVWDWDLVSNTQIHSPQWEALLGYDGTELAGNYEQFLALVHPDDIARVETALHAYLEGTAPAYDVDMRMRCKDGSWSWIVSRGTVVRRDAHGKPERMLGTHTDINALKKSAADLRSLNIQLQENTDLLQATLTSISQGIIVFDAALRVRRFNPRACELLDIPSAFLATRPTLQELGAWQRERGDFGDDGVLVQAHARDYVQSDGRVGEVPTTYLRQTRAGTTLEIKTQILTDGGMVRTFADVTDYVRAEEERQRLDKLLDATQSLAEVGGWEVDGVADQVFWTDGVYRIFETTPEDYTPTTAMETVERFFTPESAARIRESYHNAANPSDSHDLELQAVTARGKAIWVQSKGTSVRRNGQIISRTSVLQNITERKRAEALILQQAFFDTLTGLPNRRMLRDRMEQEIKKCRRDGQLLALLFIDLDHFKGVNDTLGHGNGDLLLVEAAQRLRRCVRESDTVARMGGDEFTVLVTGLDETKSLEPLLQKILTALGQVFQLGSEQVFVSASIGVTLYPVDGHAIDDLLKNADQALYVAKGAGRNRYSFFTPALQEAAQTRARLAHDLRTGLAEQQFHMVYQPIVDLATGAIHKAEALIRWQHPTRGMVNPATFIPIAEASGLIVDIGEWVFAQAAHQVKAWRAALHPDFQISVNKSPVQFQHDTADRPSWALQLQTLGLPGSSIVVEITEGLLLDTSPSVVTRLLDIGNAGIQVSLDDFGTGYSSLSYLQKFDIDYLKIDQSFVRHLIPDSTDLALCKAIIVMAHALGMKVIAEGVETEQQRDLLAAAGCDYGQGYWFARPMAAEAFASFVRQRTT